LSRVKIIARGKGSFSRPFAIPHFGAAVKSSRFLSPGSGLILEPEQCSEKLFFPSAGAGENFNEWGN